MAEKHSWRLVIDASVTSAASSQTRSPDPTPRRCRELLQAILRICHRLVMSSALRDEWRRHRSQFSHTWLTSMYARKKVVVLEPHPEDLALQRAVLDTARSETDREAMAKDLLLLEAALASDGIIFSRDAAARGLFRAAAKQVGRIREVLWVNPVHDDGLMAWLEGEAALRPGAKLES